MDRGPGVLSAGGPPAVVASRLGRIELDEPVAGVLVVRASGYVGPRLLRRDLAAAARFGRARPPGWAYVVDIGAVRVANPLNVAVLRRVRRLPGLGAYVVVAPRRTTRTLASALGRLVGTDAVVARVEEALELVAAGASRRPGPAPPATARRPCVHRHSEGDRRR